MSSRWYYIKVGDVYEVERLQEEPDGHVCTCDTEADAVLISRAPEMLEFLQHLGAIKDDGEAIDFIVNYLPDLLDEIEETMGIEPSTGGEDEADHSGGS